MRSRRKPALTTALVLLATLASLTGCSATVTPGADAVVRDAAAASAEATRWPRRYPESVLLGLDADSTNVDLVRLVRSDAAQLVELRPRGPGEVEAIVRTESLESRLAWVHAPPFATRLLLCASADGAVRGRAGIDPAIATLVQAFSFPTRLRSYLVLDPVGQTPRGVCVLLSGLLGPTSQEAELMQLVARGWIVVLSVQDDALRDNRAAAAQITGTRSLAALVDAELAEEAFGVELVVGQLCRERPELASDPLVLVGSSFGAISLPACAARLAESRRRTPEALPPLTAAVLVGGGAGIDEIVFDSPPARSWAQRAGFEVDRDDEAGRAALRADAALAPERCLWALDGRPVLLVDAAFDRVIPSSTADRLWELLGRPERWTYPVGHVGLFMLLGRAERERIADWIDRRSTEAKARAQS